MTKSEFKLPEKIVDGEVMIPLVISLNKDSNVNEKADKKIMKKLDDLGFLLMDYDLTPFKIDIQIPNCEEKRINKYCCKSNGIDWKKLEKKDTKTIFP